jgi:hypothetical protein
MYETVTGQLFEIGRQLRQPNGYPFDAELLKIHLQAAIEGCFNIPDWFRDTNELSIEIPALPHATLAEIQETDSWVKAIERDTSPEGPVTLRLNTVLRPDEKAIDGKEYERRLVTGPGIVLGYAHRKWLRKNQDKFPEFMALLGKIYIDFSGTVVVDDDGNRSVPCCHQRGSRWFGIWRWLSSRFFANDRVAVAGK